QPASDHPNTLAWRPAIWASGENRPKAETSLLAVVGCPLARAARTPQVGSVPARCGATSPSQQDEDGDGSGRSGPPCRSGRLPFFVSEFEFHTQVATPAPA